MEPLINWLHSILKEMKNNLGFRVYQHSRPVTKRIAEYPLSLLNRSGNGTKVGKKQQT